MASPSPKKRKVSPSTSYPVAAFEDARNRTHLAPDRRSFLSPTKASLARFNPSLLPRPRSSGSDTRPHSSGNPFAPTLDQRAALTSRPVSQGADQARDRTSAFSGLPPSLRSPARRRRRSDIQNELDRQLAGEIARAGQADAETLERVAEEVVGGTTTPPGLPAALMEEEDVENTPPGGGLFVTPAKRPRRGEGQTLWTGARMGLGLDGVNEARNGSPSSELQSKSLDLPVGRTEIATARAQDPAVMEQEEEKRKLEQELQELDRDVKLLQQYAAQFGEDVGEVESDTEQLEHLAALLTSGQSQKEKSTPSAPQPLSTLLTSFLPFAQAMPFSKDATADGEDDAPIPSHKPVELDDPLPHLQLFTPFAITSAISPPTASNEQKHTMQLTSPSSLLTANLVLTIANPPNEAQYVSALEVQSFSSWAQTEIGPFIHSRAEEKDITTIGWALSSYWDLAVKRAECWTRCINQWGHLIPNEDTAGRKGRSSHNEHSSSIKPTRKVLTANLGRKELVFSNDESVVLQIGWCMEFDWTGEAESVVSAEAMFPRVWREEDERGGLRKVPELFQRLVKKKGVLGAIGVLVQSLFGDGEEDQLFVH